MKGVLKTVCWALLLFLITTGLSLWGMFLDPWTGAYGGEHPLIFLGVPFWALFIGLSAFEVYPGLALLAGGVAQFLACLIIVGLVRLLWGLGRLFFRLAWRNSRK